MAAYVILDIEVTDPALYDEYKKLAPAAVTAYGGKYLARGSRVEALEGDWQPSRVVVLEFPTCEQAHAWADSPEYAPAKALRQRAATTRAILLQGV